MNLGAHSGLRHGDGGPKSRRRNEYLAAENRILEAQLETPANSVARRDVEFRADFHLLPGIDALVGGFTNSPWTG